MQRALDRVRAGALQARSLVAALLVAMAVGAAPQAASAADPAAFGASLPVGVRELSPGRFAVDMSWQFVWKWFDKQYPRSKYPRIDIVNQPGIKAVHVKNPDPKGRWDGINVYELKGRVKLYVLERREAAPQQ